MRYRRVMLLGALAAVVAGASVPLAGQAPQAAGSAAPTTSWMPARTAWGDPDLRGIWRNVFQGLAFERPKELGRKRFTRRPKWPPRYGRRRSAGLECGRA